MTDDQRLQQIADAALAIVPIVQEASEKMERIMYQFHKDFTERMQGGS